MHLILYSLIVKHQLFNRLDCVFVGVKPTPSWLLLQYPLRPHRPFLHQIHHGTRPSPRSWAQSWSNEWRKISSVSILVKSSIKTPCQVSDSSASSMISFPRKTGTGCLGNRLSQSKNEEIKSQRVSKLPKIEGMSLHDLLVDEPPSVEVTNSGMGINGIRSILELQNFGIALCKGAHLGNLRAFSHKFLSFLTVRLDSDLGLRCPNVLEAQSADKAIWGSISDLLNEQNWSLDECLCEFSMCVQTLLHYYSQGQKLRSLRWYLRHGDQMTKGAKARAKKKAAEASHPKVAKASKPGYRNTNTMGSGSRSAWSSNPTTVG